MSRWWLVVLVLVAFWLRVPGLFANQFHADEALFASWARLIAVWRDPLLATQAVDKPPLLFYLQALFYPLFGPVTWAARMPNLIASLLLVPLTAVFTHKLYRNETVTLTAVSLITLLPLTIQFSSTAFIDPLLTLLLVGALTAVAGRRVGWAGVLFGLALAAKYQALLFLPLLVGLGWVRGARLRDLGRFAAGALPVAAVLLAWEWARAGELALWSAQIGNFGGVRLSWSWELWPRLLAWGRLWQLALGGWLLVGLLGLTAVLLLIRAWRVDRVDTAVDLLLLLFLSGYAALHWLLAIPVWDRYLLLMMPLVGVLFGRGLAWLLARLPVAERLRPAVAAGMIGALLVVTAVGARSAAFDLGGTPTADQGAHEVGAFLADAPYGTVLYDHWFSWQWRYHLFDTGVYVSWFPHPAALAEDLTAFGDEGTRYVALPASDAARPVQHAIATAGYRLQPVLRTAGEPGIILYEIE